MTHTLPTLPFAPDALAPAISAETIEFHYGKHHQAYADTLNKLIVGTEFENASLEEIVQTAPNGPIFNNAAQVWNHSFYFLALSPTPKNEPTEALADTISRDFGSFAEFREAFTKAAIGQFGSGWAWLVRRSNGTLAIETTGNAETPLRDTTKMPLMTADVWEHAYYIDCRNRRAEYLGKWFSVLDWAIVEERFAA